MYTIIILTAIAVSLGVIAFQNINLTTPAYAAPAPIPTPAPAAKDTVYIGRVVDVNIVQINGHGIYDSYHVRLGCIPVATIYNDDK